MWVSFFGHSGFHLHFSVNFSLRFICSDINSGQTSFNDQTDVPFNSNGILARASLSIFITHQC